MLIALINVKKQKEKLSYNFEVLFRSHLNLSINNLLSQVLKKK